MSRLYVSQTVTLDAAGDGTVSFRPSVYGVTWSVNRITVLVNADTPKPTAKVYLGSVSPSSYVEGTRTGNNDITDTRLSVGTLENLLVVWNGGLSGAQATAIISGEEIR